MLSIDKLKAVKHIITHENCPDGIASAMILKDALPRAKVTFLQYDTAAHIGLEPEDGMLFCDFSPHKDYVAIFKARGAIVLDHHKTQKAVVEQFGDLGVFADETAEPGICGATLAFREVWLPLYDDAGLADAAMSTPRTDLVRDFATLAGIRDTWQKKDPKWRAACEQAEALQFWPIEELLNMGLTPEQWRRKLELGPVLFAKKLRSAQKCIDHGVSFTTGKGRRVLAFEGMRQSSDAAELLGDKADLVVGFGYTAEANMPKVIYSTRSHTGFDCSTLALGHGGGGHTAAAGFSLAITESTPQPYELLKMLMSMYEKVEKPWLKLVAEHKKDKSFEAKAAYGALLREHVKSPYAWL